MATIKTKNYMSNKEFLEELVTCQKKGVMSNKLGGMFKMLVERYGTKHFFSGYTYNDEMVSSGIVSCCAAFDKFDPKKSSNPFAFFTAVAHNSFLQILNKEKRQQNIRDKLLVEANLTPSFGYSGDLDQEEGHGDDWHIPVGRVIEQENGHEADDSQGDSDAASSPESPDLIE